MATEEVSPSADALAGLGQGTLQLHTQISSFNFDPCNLLFSPTIPYSDFDRLDKIMPGKPTLTPPKTQSVRSEDDLDKNLEHGQALVPDHADAVTGPLFEDTTPKEPTLGTPTPDIIPAEPVAADLTLPEKWNKDFSLAHFSALVIESVEDNDGLRDYLGKNIKVVVYDRWYDREPEVILFDEMFARANKWLKVRIPDAAQPVARDVYNYTTGCLLQGQFEARRLAWEGKLTGLPNNSHETFDWLINKYYDHGCSFNDLKGNPIATRRPGKPGAKGVLSAKTVTAPRTVRPKPVRKDRLDQEEDRVPRATTRTTTGRVRKPSPKAAGAAADSHAEVEAARLKVTPNKVSPTKIAGSRVARNKISTRTLSASKVVDNESPDIHSSRTPSPVRIKLLVTERSSPSSTAASIASSPEPAASVEATAPVLRVTPGTVTKKRKRDVSDDTSPVPRKESKRKAFDPNNNNGGNPERFAKAVKGFLNERSKDTAAYATFEDGQALCPEDGPEHPHYKEELALAETLKFSRDQYLCQKYRFFLAVAMLTEQNLRTQQANTASVTGHKSNLLVLNKTQTQLYNNIDVNKSSKMFDKFKDFGWIPDMILKGNDHKSKFVNPVYAQRYPATVRKDLIDQLIAWEHANVENVSNRVVQTTSLSN